MNHTLAWSLLSLLWSSGVSAPDDEVLLFRQKDPKPLTPRLSSLKRRDANFLKSGPTRRAHTRAARCEERPSWEPAGRRRKLSTKTTGTGKRVGPSELKRGRLLPGGSPGAGRWLGASLLISTLSGFRPRATSHFCFGKSDQNHGRPVWPY